MKWFTELTNQKAWQAAWGKLRLCKTPFVAQVAPAKKEEKKEAPKKE